MDTEMNDELHAERTALRKKLTDSAMLALSPEAAEELARDFDGVNLTVPRVV